MSTQTPIKFIQIQIRIVLTFGVSKFCNEIGKVIEAFSMLLTFTPSQGGVFFAYLVEG